MTTRGILRRILPPLAFLAGFGIDGEPAFAQEAPPPPRAMSLTDALAYARAHQPRIHAALARVKAENENAAVPRAQWLPRVGVTAQGFAGSANNTTASTIGVSSLDLPRIGGTRSQSSSSASWTPYGSTLAGAGVTQEVFDFGRIAAQTAAADAVVSVRRYDAETEMLDIEIDVEEAFFAVQAAKAVLVASENAYERSSAHRDLARAGVSSGLRSPIELTRAEADLQRFDIGRIRARGGIAIAQSVLAAAVGWTEPTLDAGAAPKAPSDMPALATAVERASARDPRLQAALAQLKAQEQRTRAIGAEMRPDIIFTGSINGRAGGTPPSSGERPDGTGWLPTVPNWDIGLVLSWPLYDGTVSARKSASRAQEDVRKDEIEVNRQVLVTTIQQTYVGVDVARTVLPGLQRAAEAAIANYAQADARFKAGLGTSVELADAEALRATSEIDLAIGTFQLAKARAVFGRAIAEGL